MVRLLATAVIALSLALGCGPDDRETLTVAVAASAAEPLREIARDFERRNPGVRVRVDVGGSDALAARIERGVPLDLFVSAHPALIARLQRAGLVGPAQPIAEHHLVVIARADGPVRTISDLADPKNSLALGHESVPIGVYARQALAAIGPEFSRLVLANVRSNEPDVRGVVAKVRAGAVDAGVVYRSDARALEGRVRSIAIPGEAQPPISYHAALTRRARDRPVARRFAAELDGGRARAHFCRAGFVLSCTDSPNP